MDDTGDVTLLESIITPFFEPSLEATRSEQLKSKQSEEDIDLAEVLALHDDEFKSNADSESLYSGNENNDGYDEPQIEVIYRREEDPTEDQDTTQDESQVDEKPVPKYEPGEDDFDEEYAKKKPRNKFFQTHNKDYRIFMEELILVKCCSKQILDLLENTKTITRRDVQIKNDPGFGPITHLKAWTWIVKEAFIAAFSATKKDKIKRRMMSALSSETFSCFEKLFKNLHQDLKNLIRTYDKVQSEFQNIIAKALKRFSNNLDAAEDYELSSPSLAFLFYRSSNGSKDSFIDCCGEIMPKQGDHYKLRHGSPSDSNLEPLKKTAQFPERNLQIRCSIDGVTIRSGVIGKSWLKFQNVDQFKDIETFLKILTNAMCKDIVTARQSLGLANEILEIHHGLFQWKKPVKFKDSILQSILRCKEVLEKPRKILTFLPREEVMMLHSLKSANAGFDLIKPLVIDLQLLFEEDFKMIEVLCSQHKHFKDGTKVGRVPMDRLMRFEMEVEDTKINVARILNRYPNLREAKEIQERIKKSIAEGKLDDSFEVDAIVETPVETVYQRPPELQLTPSTQEMFEWFRKQINDDKNSVLQPNPAHLLLTDVGHQYKIMATRLLGSRTITPEVVAFCSDPIRNFYQAVENFDTAKQSVLTQLMQASENLLYTEVHPDVSENDEADPSPRLVPTSFWIQIICKMLHVWDFHSLPKHLQSHFLSVNDTSIAWIERLENTFSEFGTLVKKFKDDFNTFHDYVETMHGFSTWMKKKFIFTFPQDVVVKWKKQIELEGETKFIKEESDTSPIPILRLNFSGFDMSILKVNRDDQTTAFLTSLNKSSGNIQLGIAGMFFAFLDNMVRRSIVNLTSAFSIFEKNMIMKTLKSTLASNKKLSNLQYIHQLEDLVLALTFEKNHKLVKEMIAYIDLLDRAIAQFSRLFQTVQLQLEDRGIIPSSTGSRKDRIRKKVLQNDDEDHLNHDIWLNETKQILRNSVEAMPSAYEIQEDSINSTLMKWIEMAEKDARLKDIFRRQTKLSIDIGSAVPEVDDTGGTSRNSSECVMEGRQKDDNSEVHLGSLPIDFEKAMMETTLGKAFFPDPDHFHSDMEIWRSVCFKMLSTALEKFRELTTTKIMATKTILIQPILSSSLITVNPIESTFDEHDKNILQKESYLTTSTGISEIKSKTAASKDTVKSRREKEPTPRIGNTEGHASILCFITAQLSPKDRLLVSASDLKHLKTKFYNATTLVEKFKKDLDATERLLVNSLSLAMAGVEYKHLPHHLPVSPLDNDYLKAHDLEEVGSKTDLRKTNEEGGRSYGLGSRVRWRRDAIKDAQPSPSNSNLEFADPYEVELHWDSKNKKKLLCKILEPETPTWFEIAQLHIEGQMRLIHMLLDEIIQDFEKAKEFLRESRDDFTVAKEILQKTWKGIGRDNKRGRIPDSGMLVLVKLYRHQIATAVVNMKQIRKNAKEVRYLLSQSARKAKLWSKEEDDYPIKLDKNYAMTLDNLELNTSLRARAPKNLPWVMKRNPRDAQDTETTTLFSSLEDERFLDIKAAVEVKSSTSVDIPKDMMSQLSEIAMTKSFSSDYITMGSRDAATERQHGAIGASGRDFYSIAASIENILLHEIEHSVGILRLPNCSLPQPAEGTSTSGEGIPNIVGLLAALAAATVSIHHFKNIVPLQRTFITERLNDVETKLNKIHLPNFGSIDGLVLELRKIRVSVKELDKTFREKFCFEGEFSEMKDMLTRSFQPFYGKTPMEFVEELATISSGHVWTIISGVPEVGVIVRHNKSLESHALSNIPLSSKLEILLCLIQFLEKIVEHVLSSVESLKKGIGTAKGLLKTHGKEVMKRKRAGIGTGKKPHSNNKANEMSKWEVEEHLQSFAKISNASKRAEEDVVIITDLLKRASDMLQQISIFLTLKMKLEPVSGVPTIDNDLIFRAQNWQTVETITGLAPQPTNVTPPILLKKIAKKAQKEEGAQTRYKAVWENKVLELEMFFEQFCKNHHVAVDVPLMFVPTSARTRHAYAHT